ncbi:MAG TPA: ABC transporter permease [Dongiaceae bacterium]|nr:ABC transporter permease [Dongiaceae bacterium]
MAATSEAAGTASIDNGRAQIAAQKAATRTVVSRWLLLSPALVIILGCGLLPLFIILGYSVMQPGDYAGVVCCKLVPDAWINLFFEQDMFSDALAPNYAYYIIFARSILMALFTTALAIGVGFPTAYFIATRSPKMRNLMLFLITIPFWTNLLIRTYSIIMVLQDQGVLNKILMGLGLIHEPLQLMYTNVAISYGLAYAYLPYMVLPLYASMEKLDFRLIEAGYDLYANRFQVLRRLIIPLVKPGIVAGSILVFIPAIGDYVITTQLGGGTRMMFGSLISQQFLTARNWPQGSALSLGLMLVVMIALFVYAKKAVGRAQS